MLLNQMQNVDPVDLGKLIQMLIQPERYQRTGLNEPRGVGQNGNVRVPVSEMPEGLYTAPRNAGGPLGGMPRLPR